MLSLALPLRRIILENHPLGLHLPYVTAMHCFPQLCLVHRRCDVRILGTAASAHYRSMSSQGPRCRRSAFTLIELLTVVAVIAILAGIAFGVLRGVGQQAKVNRATAELASLTTSLEAYKKYFGDYPRVTTATESQPFKINLNSNRFDPTLDDRAYAFFQSMTGRLSPQVFNGGVVQRQIDKDGTMVNKYVRSFIDINLYTLERLSQDDDRPKGELATPVASSSPTQADPAYYNAILDPWGNRYLYHYKDRAPANAVKWKQSGYVLFSAGPDKEFKLIQQGAEFDEADSRLNPFLEGNLLDPNAPENADNIYATP